MPFTPSHAVIALPFLRTPLVPAAIAVGAMAPDLPLFVQASPLGYARTHDFAWLPVTVILALMLLVVWRCVLRPAVRELSPTWLAQRLPQGWDRRAAGALRDTLGVHAVRMPARRQRWSLAWGDLVLLAVSLAMGVASHILWDLFTHEGRWGTAVLPALGEEWGPLLGFKWLQYGSGVVGLVIIAVWAVVRLRRRDPAPRVERVLPDGIRWAWWASLPVTLGVSAAIGLVAYGPLDDEFTVAHLVYRVFVPATAVWGMLTLILAIAVQALRTRRPAARR
ncbi:DUF4184 family protein [Microbacterium sp. B2969]|uniref:DUF4184 family protein n=1 Tax=Microbacterium alkaliflavum TaxID=3248839 RepID=A0ABW7QEF9_9MICO